MPILPSQPTRPINHRPAVLRLLCALGWRYISPAECQAKRTGIQPVFLETSLLDYLKARRFEYKGRLHSLTSNSIEQVVRELSTAWLSDGLATANQRVFETLSSGLTVTEFMGDGKRHQPTIALIDWENPDQNSFEVSDQFELVSMQGTHVHTQDIVGFVNGIPLVVIDAAHLDSAMSDESAISDGIRRHLRNQRPDEVAQLFVYAQLLISLGRNDGRYGTNHSPEKSWARWREEEFDQSHITRLKNRPVEKTIQEALLAGSDPAERDHFARLWSKPMLATEADRLLVGLLTPVRLLEILRFYILFDRKNSKLVARHHQFFGVRALIERISLFDQNRARKGGVIWHAAGSGKSATILFLTRAIPLIEDLKQCQILVVTDHLEQEERFSKNYFDSLSSAAATVPQKDRDKARVITGRDLTRRIMSGSERIIFTFAGKFGYACGFSEILDTTTDLIVLFHEGRDFGPDIRARMRRALPGASFVVFTGTPLLQSEKSAGRLGTVIHAYPMQSAVQDEVLSPLLVEGRVPDPEMIASGEALWFEQIAGAIPEHRKAGLKTRYLGGVGGHSALKRIEMIAWDIALHFDEHIKQIQPGLKGQIATGSKLDAIRYKRILDKIGIVSSAVIIYPPDVPEGGTVPGPRGASLVRKWWDKNVGDDQPGYERDVLDRFSREGDPDLLIVVDRFLTGFHEPANAVLYIDKPLHDHQLLAAISRVARLHEAKRFGVLVDYRGFLSELIPSEPEPASNPDPAVEVVAPAFPSSPNEGNTGLLGGYERGDVEGIYLPFGSQTHRLPALHSALRSLFADIRPHNGFEEYRRALAPDYREDGLGGMVDCHQARREDFYFALTRFGLCLHLALSSHGFFTDSRFPESLRHEYRQDLRFFSDLRNAVAHDALESGNASLADMQVRRLADKQDPPNEVREPEGAYLLPPSADSEDPAAWSDEKARNETDRVRTRLRQLITENLAVDPFAQRLFADQLTGSTATAVALEASPLRQYEIFREFEKKVLAREVPGLPDALGDSPRARACFGVFRMVLGDAWAASLDAAQEQEFVDQAAAIDAAVTDTMAAHSLSALDMEAALRNRLLPPLFMLIGLEKSKQVIEEVIRITRLHAQSDNVA